MRGTQVSRIFVLGHTHEPEHGCAPGVAAPAIARRGAFLKRTAATAKLLASLVFLGAKRRAQANVNDPFIVIGAFIPRITMAPMNSDTGQRSPIAAAGVVCFRGADVLLVQRGKPPLAGQWSLPGGRIEWGERAADAALRELKEETGCDADIIGLIDVVDALMASRESPDSPPWGHYVLIDYAARWRSGEPQGGDDARQARFFSPAEIEGLGLWSETIRIIAAARQML